MEGSGEKEEEALERGRETPWKSKKKKLKKKIG